MAGAGSERRVAGTDKYGRDKAAARCGSSGNEIRIVIRGSTTGLERDGGTVNQFRLEKHEFSSLLSSESKRLTFPLLEVSQDSSDSKVDTQSC